MNMTADMAVISEYAPVKDVAAKPMIERLRWSVQRELWENRSVFIVPSVMAALIVLSISMSQLRHPETLILRSAMDTESQRMDLAVAFDMTATLVMITSFLVGVFYCLDALYAERKDRSILFWKSLPVSDSMTVAAKLIVPMVMLPLVTFAVVLVADLLMLIFGAIYMVAHPGIVFTSLPLVQMEIGFIYGLVVTSLWYAPIYGWLLLVSSWVKRAALLWAILPWFAAGVLEAIAFHTSYVRTLVSQRFLGFFHAAFRVDFQQQSRDAKHFGGFLPLSTVTPGHFLSTPELWIGLAFAAAFFVLVVRARRYRDPI